MAFLAIFQIYSDVDLFFIYDNFRISKNILDLRRADMANKYVEPFIPFVDALAETFGKNCEVVLHDFTKPDQSIIKIAHGHITGRDVGGPATDLILSFLGKKGKNVDCLIGYPTKTKQGAELKSTTVFIRDNRDKIVGALCINMDITPYISLKSLSEQFCLRSDVGGERQFPEKFESNVDQLINELLEQSITKIGKPIVHMRKEDKLQIIRDLKENGLFLIKGSAKRVSQELNVSLATIYKYLEEIQEI
jgi:predicted transcriptional regulator YheO